MVSIMSGMMLGFVWDIYRIIRHYAKLGSIGTAAGDIAYWILSIYFSIMIIDDISYGNVRLFILLGFLLGAAVYFYGVSGYTLKLFIFMIDSLLFLINKLITFIIAPVKFLIGKIAFILYPFKIKIVKGRDNVKRKLKFFRFRIKKVFKNKKMLYNKKKISRKRKKKKTYR